MSYRVGNLMARGQGGGTWGPAQQGQERYLEVTVKVVVYPGSEVETATSVCLGGRTSALALIFIRGVRLPLSVCLLGSGIAKAWIPSLRAQPLEVEYFCPLGFSFPANSSVS